MSGRIVEPEFLDSLRGDDPEAIRSRRDLRRLNWWMRNEGRVLHALNGLKTRPATIAEAGSGDGTFMLSVARQLKWKHPVRLTMIDMQPVISRATLEAFSQLGWDVQVRSEKIQDWLETQSGLSVDLVLGNLFWHHLSDAELRDCFATICRTSGAFVACEPRRWIPAQISTRFLWVIGCSSVTCHDARVSVTAGFRGRELTALWPADQGMKLQEYPGGWTSHLFVAERVGDARAGNAGGPGY